MTHKSLKRFSLIAVLIAVCAAVAGCGGGTTKAAPASMCGYLVGDGTKDAKIHDVIYPNQEVKKADNEVVSYVPCGPRNFIINNGKQRNANNQLVGDKFEPTLAYTSDGTAVNVWSRTFWTLNENKQALLDYATLCFKYNCASSTPTGGEANFSTKGWNGLLAENMGPAIEESINKAMHQVGDDVWKTHDPALIQKVGTLASQYFADAVRATTGFDVDLFCGSGNSGWPNANSPGKGDFNCSPVHIKIDRVIVADSKISASAAQEVRAKSETTANAKRLAAAEALYGKTAGSWLALQDLCLQQKTHCNVNVRVDENGNVKANP